uniref:Uncharacterized protein n=1 Tax=Knipowitschia caucasica TaxID=637954 RepID=A0AAV2M3X3_KNICA
MCKNPQCAPDKFKDCPVIAVAARPGGPEAADTEEPQGVSELIQLLKQQTYLPQRDASGDLLMAVDHCFSIRGQGTVMTGTILQGALAISDSVEIPALKGQSSDQEQMGKRQRREDAAPTLSSGWQHTTGCELVCVID